MSKARHLTLFGIVAAASMASCGPHEWVTGAWHFDGTGFGLHEVTNRSSGAAYSCFPTDDVGVVELAFVLATHPRGEQDVARVLFSPNDESSVIDVKMPWSHARFERSDCSRHQGSAEIKPDADAGFAHATGSLFLQCAKDGNAISLDLSYMCRMHTR